jgi:hypothetical protein
MSATDAWGWPVVSNMSDFARLGVWVAIAVLALGLLVYLWPRRKEQP